MIASTGAPAMGLAFGIVLGGRNRIERIWRSGLARRSLSSAGLAVFACLLVQLCCLRASQAATPSEWETAGGGSWNVGSNWKPGHAPTASEDASIGQNATSTGSPGSVTLDANQTAYGLTLSPGGGKAIHIDPGSSSNNTLTLLSADATTDGVSTFYSIYAASGIASAINAPIQLGNGSSGSFTAVVNSFDPTFFINGAISQSPGQTWGVRIVGNNQGVVDYATTLKTYSGDTTIGTTGILQIDKEDSIPHGATSGIVSIEGNGRLQFGAATSQAINALSSTSTTAVVTKSTGANSATLSISGTTTATFAGSITNPSGVGLLNLSKTNTGTEILTGTNSYRGTTSVSGGTLLVDGIHNSAGSYSDSAIGAILGGRGTINLASGSSVNATAGRIAAGDNGPGIFNINGTLNMSGNGGLNIQLGGTSPGNGSGFYDQVNMTSPTGAINSSFAHFSLSLVNGFVPQPSDIFYVLTRADSGSFSGTQPFDAAAEGATVHFGSDFVAKVTYQANWTGNQATSTLTGGNDMAFYNIVVPEPASVTLLGLGMVWFCTNHKRRLGLAGDQIRPLDDRDGGRFNR